MDAVGVRVEDGILKIVETFGTGFKGVSLKVGKMQSSFEPLRAKIAFELIGFDIIFLPHFFL